MTEENNIDESKTYVYTNTEVKLTGRTANKEMKSARKGKEPTVHVLHEITPADPENGSWKKWVRLGELFEIK
jgi:hypothetical protein